MPGFLFYCSEYIRGYYFDLHGLNEDIHKENQVELYKQKNRLAPVFSY